MNVLNQIKKDLANELGCKSWEELRNKLGPKTMDIYEVKLCEKYADLCINASLNKASENVCAYIGNEGTEDTPLVSKESIKLRSNFIFV